MDGRAGEHVRRASCTAQGQGSRRTDCIRPSAGGTELAHGAATREVPAASQEAPAASQEVPAASQEASAASQEAPAASQEAHDASQETLAASQGMSTASQEAHATLQGSGRGRSLHKKSQFCFAASLEFREVHNCTPDLNR